MKPTFVGIGAQKCASTWLYGILKEHPEVCVGPEKEINFFSHHYDHGYQWYESQFGRCGSAKSAGEISPSYFSEPSVPARVRDYMPSARILVTLRDPVQRAQSQHRHEIRLGYFAGDDLSFEAGLENNPMYTEQGLYATHLKRWLEHFPAEQIHVVLMEEVKGDPLAVARGVYDFLGVDATFEPECLTRHFNPSFANRYRLLANIKDSLYRVTRQPAFRWLWSMGDMLGLKALYRRVNRKPSNSVIPEAGEQTLACLREQFAPEVRELSGLIDKPLDDWL